MPYFNVETNKEIDTAATEALLEKTATFLAELLGKPGKFIMVSVNSNAQMLFGGNTDPAAFIQLKSIGLPKDQVKEYSKSICEYIESEIGVSGKRIYIEFTDLDGKMFGFNGGTC